MFARIAGELVQAAEETQARQIALFKQVHPEYGAGVEAAIAKLKK